MQTHVKHTLAHGLYVIGLYFLVIWLGPKPEGRDRGQAWAGDK